MRMVIPSDDRDEGSEIYPFFGQAVFFFIYEVEKNERRLLEARKNPMSAALRDLSHGKRPAQVQQMIDDHLNDCDLFVAVRMSEAVVSELVAQGKKVVFVEGGAVRALAARLLEQET